MKCNIRQRWRNRLHGSPAREAGLVKAQTPAGQGRIGRPAGHVNDMGRPASAPISDSPLTLDARPRGAPAQPFSAGSAWAMPAIGRVTFTVWPLASTKLATTSFAVSSSLPNASSNGPMASQPPEWQEA